MKLINVNQLEKFLITQGATGNEIEFTQYRDLKTHHIFGDQFPYYKADEVEAIMKPCQGAYFVKLLQANVPTLILLDTEVPLLN